MDEVQGPEVPGVQDAPEARKGNRGRIIIICVVAVVLALGGAGFLAANLSTQAEQRAEAEASVASASAAASADASASAEAKRTADNAASAARARARSVAEEARKAAERAERADSELKQMEARGWTSAGNQMYFQYLSDSEFTCGRWKCTFLDVVSMAPNGCPGGIYVAVSIDRGEGSIGSTNEITAGLPTGKVARVKLEDTSNQGDGFQITKMNCHM